MSAPGCVGQAAAGDSPAGRRYRPVHPLADRPPISRPSAPAPPPGAARAGAQPREGALGLIAVALLCSVLLFGWGGPDSTLRVFGILTVFALPPAAVVALWWEDWPGSKLRPRWSGFVDLALIAVCGIVLTLLGQALVQHLDPVALFVADAGPAHAAIFPALLPLGAATFTAMLQLTLVSEGWPLRRLGRLRGGVLALLVTWTAGLALERGLVGSGALAPDAFAACLACVSAVQVLGWVVLRGAPLSKVRSRGLRLAIGNASTAAAGTAAFLLIRVLVPDSVTVAAIAAGVIGAGLVVGMLFEGWPIGRASPAVSRTMAIVVTFALAALGIAGCGALARGVGLPATETAGWTAYALNSLATAVILHVGVFRRWPLRSTATATATA